MKKSGYLKILQVVLGIATELAMVVIIISSALGICLLIVKLVYS